MACLDCSACRNDSTLPSLRAQYVGDYVGDYVGFLPGHGRVESSTL